MPTAFPTLVFTNTFRFQTTVFKPLLRFQSKAVSLHAQIVAKMLHRTLAEKICTRSPPRFFPGSQFLVTVNYFNDASSLSDIDFYIIAASNFSCTFLKKGSRGVLFGQISIQTKPS